MAILAVIGGVAAGMSAAAKARRTNADLEIRVYTDEAHISYGACGLPYYISGEIEKETRLMARSVEQFATLGIKVFTRYRVEEIRPRDQIIQVRNLNTGEMTEVAYDQLVIATGASVLVPPVEGRDLTGVFKLRNVVDGVAIRRYIEETKPKAGVIVGGGYIGLEMAETMHRYGIKVTIVEMAPQIVPNMDKDMAQILENYLISQGIEVRTAEKVLSLRGGRESIDQAGFSGEEVFPPDRLQQVITERGIIPADLVLLSVGVVPNSQLAEKAGIELGVRRAIRINSRMETNLPRIYAAGDCANTTHLVTGEEVYIPMGTTANKQGRTAGENAAGGKAEFKGVVGTGIAKVLDLEIARTGLNERECQDRDLPYEVRIIKAWTKAGYYPGAGQIHVKVLAQKSGGRLLGAQIVGQAGSGKRIDVFAAALTLGATIEQLKDLDLAYAPPFAPVYDPILVAINQF